MIYHLYIAGRKGLGKVLLLFVIFHAGITTGEAIYETINEDKLENRNSVVTTVNVRVQAAVTIAVAALG